MKNNFIVVLLFSIISFGVSAQQGGVISFQNDVPEASISFCVKDVLSGKVDCQYNSKRALAPASVLKLASTISALDKYGADYKFKTKIGYTGEIINGVLKGSLVVKASGDPTWNSKYFTDNNVFEKIKKILKAKGINRVLWGVVIDEGNVDSSTPTTWIWEDIANYFGSPSHAINIYDNTYKINFLSRQAGTHTAIKSVIPKLEDIDFDNQVIASNENKDNAWIFGGPRSSVRVIKGSIPKNRSSFIVKGSIPNTNKVFHSQLIKYLMGNGIKCKDKLLNSKINKFKTLGVVESPRFAEIVYFTNQKSVNLYAEALSKKVGSIESFWKSKGSDMQGVKMYDGCGVSRFNMLTTSFVTDLLIYAYKQDYKQDFIESLPKAGKTGTLKRFGRGTCLEGNLLAKTGSMKAVRAYAGYITLSGKQKAFSCIVNNYSCNDKEVEKQVEKLLIHLCKKI